MIETEDVVSPTVNPSKQPRVEETNSQDQRTFLDLDNGQQINSQSDMIDAEAALFPEAEQAPSEATTQTAFSSGSYSSNTFEEELFGLERQIAAVTKII